MHFVWGTLLATLPAVKLHFAIVLGFAVAELLLPARRRQPFREHFSNVQYVLLYFFVTPFALILPSALAVAVARKIGPGPISMSLESFGTYISPKRGEWPPTGLRSGQHSGNVLQETVHPFLAWDKATRARLFQARPIVSRRPSETRLMLTH